MRGDAPARVRPALTVPATAFHSGKKRAQLGARHCEKLAEQYRAMVEEYDGLAKLHDEEVRISR